MALPSISRWAGRYALVTGASYGIGVAFCRALTEYGVHVIGCARSIDKLMDLASELVTAGHAGIFHPYQCDLTKKTEIAAMFAWIEASFGGAGVDILVNNAAMASGESITDSTDANNRHVFGLNVLAVLSCNRHALASMRSRGVDDGHIFHLNSVTGHTVVKDLAALHTYGATKWVITFINEALRQELVAAGSRIRVTSISPGVVDTPLILTGFGPDIQKKIVHDAPSLVVKDVADTLIFALSTPPSVTIHELTVRATGADI